MKKLFLFAGLIFLSASAVFAVDIEQALRTVGPGAILSAGFGGFIALIGVILLYVAISYGIYLLAKKYSPKVHPAWSWIPVVQIYPLVKASGQSLWWIVAILFGNFVPFIGALVVLVSIIYIYYALAKRTGGSFGTTLLLIFFSGIMIPYLGLKAHKKPTIVAWVLGVSGTLMVFIGSIMGLAGAGKAFLELEREYNITDIAQEKMMEKIKKNPELQQQLEEAKNAMMKLEQKTEVNMQS